MGQEGILVGCPEKGAHVLSKKDQRTFLIVEKKEALIQVGGREEETNGGLSLLVQTCAERVGFWGLSNLVRVQQGVRKKNRCLSDWSLYLAASSSFPPHGSLGGGVWGLLN